MRKNRFQPLLLPFVAMVVCAALSAVSLTVALAAVFIAGTVIICTDKIIHELRSSKQ